MSDSKPVDLWALCDLCTPWCVHVVVTLRVAEHIDSGLSRIERLAEECEADSGALQRVLRHLIEKGLFLEPEPGCFELNEPARALLDPSFPLGLDLEGFGGRMAHAWGTLLPAVRSGASAYHTVFGRPFWQDLQAHPVISEQFDDLIGPAGHGDPDPVIPISCGWESVRSVVDVGGGSGSLLAAILQSWPLIRGILVDQPMTIERAASVFEAAGVADRVTRVAQSFFEPLPAGADVYLIKNVLADWPDPEALALLKRCAEAALPAGRIVILGGITPPETGAPSPELLMLVLVGGKGRSLAEFRELARLAGLEVVSTGRQPSGRYVVECQPVA